MMQEDALATLIVEDEEAHALLIEKSLSRADIATAVTHASSGFEAIAKLDEQKFDLVLLDYSLPDWDGLELLDHLVAAGLSVVMITARGSEKVAVEAMKRGAIDYLVKSTETLELLPAIIQRCATTLKAQKKLAVKKKQHEKLIGSSTDAIIATDREGRVVVFNPGAEALSGYRQEEVLGQRLPVLYESKEQAKKMMRMMREGGGSISAFETTFKAKDGTAIPVLISASILYDDEGRESGTVGFSKDLRERKRIDGQLGQQTKMLRGLQIATTRFVLGEEPKATFDLLLDLLLELTDSEYGFIGEILSNSEGKPYLKTHAITDLAWDKASREMIESAHEGLEFYNLETLFGNVITEQMIVISNDPANDPRSGGLPSGHPPLEAFMGVPFFHRGKIVGMVGVANRRDGYDEEIVEFLGPFTSTCGVLIDAFRSGVERERTEMELRSLKEFNENVVQNIPEGLMVFDREFRITLWNRVMEEAHGKTKGETIGKNVVDVMPCMTQEDITDHLRPILEGQVIELYNIPCLCTGQKARLMNHRYSPVINPSGEIIGTQLILEDVTETRQLEQQVAHLQEEIEERKLIEVAKGILMRELDLSETEGYQFIQKNAIIYLTKGSHRYILPFRRLGTMTLSLDRLANLLHDPLGKDTLHKLFGSLFCGLFLLLFAH